MAQMEANSSGSALDWTDLESSPGHNPDTLSNVCACFLLSGVPHGYREGQLRRWSQ